MSDPNPYIDPTPWGFVYVGGLVIPGVVKSIDGCEKPEEWAIQKGTSGNNATTVWRGTKLAESTKILTQLANASNFSDYCAFNRALSPKKGTKPPSFAIVNPKINFSGVTRCSTINVGTPTWVQAGNYWTGLVELVEYNPSTPAAAGQAKTAQNGTGGGAAPPKTPGEQQLSDLLEEAAKL